MVCRIWGPCSHSYAAKAFWDSRTGVCGRSAALFALFTRQFRSIPNGKGAYAEMGQLGNIEGLIALLPQVLVQSPWLSRHNC